MLCCSFKDFFLLIHEEWTINVCTAGYCMYVCVCVVWCREHPTSHKKNTKNLLLFVLCCLFGVGENRLEIKSKIRCICTLHHHSIIQPTAAVFLKQDDAASGLVQCSFFSSFERGTIYNYYNCIHTFYFIIRYGNYYFPWTLWCHPPFLVGG